MRKIFSLVLVVLMTLCVHAQKDSVLPAPYLRFPTVPPLNILKVDSVNHFTKDDMKKNKASLIIIFNPGCEHCQHETKEITANIDRFKNIQIVMTTPEPFEKMKAFYEEYKLKDFPSIIMGRDEHFTLPSFYYIHSLPFMAFYDKNQKLISVHEGSFGVEKILKEFDK